MSPLSPALLRRRNDLWQRLRSLPPQSPDFGATAFERLDSGTLDSGALEFEKVLADLSALTGWERARILAGLGWTEAEQAAWSNP